MHACNRPEIWQQTGGEVDAFTCATGTGGTLAGVATYLREQNPSVVAVLADPPGSVLCVVFLPVLLLPARDTDILFCCLTVV